jgi:hypothetical protein
MNPPPAPFACEGGWKRSYRFVQPKPRSTFPNIPLFLKNLIFCLSNRTEWEAYFCLSFQEDCDIFGRNNPPFPGEGLLL